MKNRGRGGEGEDPSRTSVPGPLEDLRSEQFYYFREGTDSRAYTRLGSHPFRDGGEWRTRFAVWAPNAERVSVIGEFNSWEPGRHLLNPVGDTGVWSGWVEGARPGQMYKYRIESRYHGYQVSKADPYARRTERPPGTASLIAQPTHSWRDRTWMEERRRRDWFPSPVTIYEVHLGSWRRKDPSPEGFLTYRELAAPLCEHIQDLGFTHVEFLPLMEHPFYGSWGYLTTGYFAPTARYGAPEDLMFLIDTLHQAGIGVILDWVPAHFPRDEFALGYFDGTHLYEHADPRQGVHPEWNSFVFNYGRHEVSSFLLSSADFWLREYHADALRVDGVASMLYRDYGRAPGEWIPNPQGGRENLEAIAFLRRLNEMVYRDHPGAQTIAEESTAWPKVSRPTTTGGLGFGFKWDMGWMHDTLEYLARDPIHRKWHHRQLTFRSVYFSSENYVLPLSHDEVVYGKGSLLSKMPGDLWQKFANLRLLFGYQFAQPGKKLLFMGGEIAMPDEWNHDRGLDWSLASEPARAGLGLWLRDLARLYRRETALHQRDVDPVGFRWVQADDADQSVLAFLRLGSGPERPVLAVFNFTPVPRHSYRLGVPAGGFWKELLNGDAHEYGGSGVGNGGGVWAGEGPWREFPHHLELTLPPLAAVFLAPEERRGSP
jgi:1,4-alpha-glucan branching enzyme